MMKKLLKGLRVLVSRAFVKVFAIVGTVLMLYACQDQVSVDVKDISIAAENDMITIGSTFAQALENPDFRSLIRNEAAKKFDNDYDILVQMLVDKDVSQGKTVSQMLQQYSDGVDIRQLLRRYPLLSVYIPKLPGFDVDLWDVINGETPRVAIAQFPNQDGEIRLVNSSKEYSWVSQTNKPEFPVVVLKENERIGIRTADKANNGRTTSIFTSEDFSYYFLDENGGENVANARKALTNTLDTKVRAAYSKSQNCSNCFHRDYIYYNISPSEGITQGAFDHNYAEAVTALEFENLTTLQSVNSNWTEGDLEFHVIAMFIGASSTLTQLEKVYHATSDDFYSNGQLTAKIIYFSPLVLVPWEMNVYGDKWKFNVYEYDPGTTTTISTSHSTTKSTNFTYDVGLQNIVKIGSGYGSSTTTVDSNSTTVTTTTTSNQLGEAVHNWFDPVITSAQYNGFTFLYSTKEISTGSIKLSVEPIRVNP